MYLSIGMYKLIVKESAYLIVYRPCRLPQTFFHSSNEDYIGQSIELGAVEVELASVLT